MTVDPPVTADLLDEVGDFVTPTRPHRPDRQALLWWARNVKRHERSRLPWRRTRLTVALAGRDVYARNPLHGNALEALQDGRLVLGRRTFLEANVLLRAEGHALIVIGEDVLLNFGAMVSAMDAVIIGDHTLVGPGCFITDGDHQICDPVVPVPQQGMVSRGATIIEDNVWLGAYVVVTSGVRIGHRSVVGAGSVVTHDIPPYSVAIGSPARVIGGVYDHRSPRQQDPVGRSPNPDSGTPASELR